MRFLAAVILACVLAISSGCTTVMKQALYGVTGASSRYFELKTAGGKTSLDRFNSVQVKPFKADALMGKLPREIVSETARRIVAKLTDTELFAEVSRQAPSQKPTLIIDGEFIDYDPGGSAIRAVGLGSNPFVTARVRFVDGSSGKVLGIAHVTGTVKSAVRTGNRELADGLAKAVEKLIKAHHCEPPED